jgi:exonuclease III
MLNNNLRIIHWNANGILNKANEFHTLLIREKIDIALISETKLKPTSQFKI